MTKFRWAFAILLTTIFVSFGAAMVQAAVSLEAFTGSWSGNTVTLEFATGSEIEHAAFHVWRAANDIAPNQVTSNTATRLTTSPILGQSACTSGSGDYTFVDSNLGSGTTYYYFLESITCGSSDSEFYGAINDPDSGLRLTSPNAPATATPTPSNTPPANSTSTATSSPTRTATSAPGVPTNTPGPTGTLIPLATEVPPSVTPAATNTTPPNVPTSTTAPQPTQGSQNVPPTDIPLPPTEIPQPTQGSVENTPVTDGGNDTGNTTPTETPAVIAAAVSPVATEVAPGGEMSSNNPAATPTLAGGIVAAPEGTGINSVPDPLVQSSSEGDGVDGLIQGLIGVILVGVVGLVGFIGWNYMRNR